MRNEMQDVRDRLVEADNAFQMAVTKLKVAHGALSDYLFDYPDLEWDDRVMRPADARRKRAAVEVLLDAMHDGAAQVAKVRGVHSAKFGDDELVSASI